MIAQRFITLIILCYSLSVIQTLDLRIHFIRKFIENERKPTVLVFNLCWGKRTELALSKEMANSGIRSTSSLESAKYLDHSLLFTTDLSCNFSEELFFQAASKHLLGSPYRWLVFSNSSANEALLKDHPFLPDSDLVVARKVDDGYEMIELHKPSMDTALISTLRGYYTNGGTLTDVRQHRSLFSRRRNLMGVPLTMSNVIQDSNTTQYHLPREDRLDLEHDAIAKQSWSCVKLGFLMLNATPRYIFSHRWGYKLNGKFSGMIADLISKKADVGTNCLLLKDRLAVVDYTDNLVTFKVRFVFRQPPLPYVANIFSLPFSTGVWIALFGCSAAATVSFYIASRWEVTFEKSPSQLDGSFGDALLLTMSAVSQQGCVLEPKKLAGRVMLWIFFAMLMLLYAAYSANIVVLLQAPSNAIRTLQQLASSKMTIALADVDYNYFVLKISDKAHYQAYYEITKKIESDKGKHQFYEFDDGVARIRQGLFAFHAITEPIYRQIEKTFMEHEKCDLMEVDFLNQIDPYTPIQKHSPYLELLRVVFKQIRESGIRAVLTNRLLTPKPRCAHHAVAFSSVGFMALESVLLFMLYGFGFSIAIAGVEILVYKLTHRHHKMPLQPRKEGISN